MKVLILFTLILLQQIDITAKPPKSFPDSTSYLRLNNKSVVFLKKKCPAVNNYQWKNEDLNTKLQEAAQQQKKGRNILIAGSVLSVVGSCMLIGGGLRSKAFASDDVFHGGPFITMSLGGAVFGATIPLDIVGGLQIRSAKKKMKTICKEF